MSFFPLAFSPDLSPDLSRACSFLMFTMDSSPRLVMKDYSYENLS